MIGQAQPLADNYPAHWCINRFALRFGHANFPNMDRNGFEL
jgi:hypothetical protein